MATSPYAAMFVVVILVTVRATEGVWEEFRKKPFDFWKRSGLRL